MATVLEKLKQLFRGQQSDASPTGGRSDTVGGLSQEELEKMPESRVQELAGHAPERVDT